MTDTQASQSHSAPLAPPDAAASPAPAAVGGPPSATATDAPAPALAPATFGYFRRAVLYPDRYAWYVLASALDIITTVTVLKHFGFREANSFAQTSIDLFGTWGLIGLKFLSVVVVVFICEFIGRRKERLGRRVASLAIALSLFPVGFALAQLVVGVVQGRIVETEWPRHDLHDHSWEHEGL
ncbi:MAG: DUF5658 family protein [Phycisphaerales bacterium]